MGFSCVAVLVVLGDDKSGVPRPRRTEAFGSFLTERFFVGGCAGDVFVF